MNEFEKKNEEIKYLKEKLKSKNKENEDLKKLQKNDNFDVKHTNQLLKSKLHEAIEICSNLVTQTEQLIRMNRKLAIKNDEIEKLDTSQAYLLKASQFLSGILFTICF